MAFLFNLKWSKGIYFLQDDTSSLCPRIRIFFRISSLQLVLCITYIRLSSSCVCHSYIYIYLFIFCLYVWYSSLVVRQLYCLITNKTTGKTSCCLATWLLQCIFQRLNKQTRDIICIFYILSLHISLSAFSGKLLSISKAFVQCTH